MIKLLMQLEKQRSFLLLLQSNLQSSGKRQGLRVLLSGRSLTNSPTPRVFCTLSLQISGFVSALPKSAWLARNDARPLCGLFLTGRFTVSRSSIHTQPAGRCAKFRWLLLLPSESLTRPGVVAT